MQHDIAYDTAAGSQSITRAIGRVISPIAFLPADAAEFFTPVNTNKNWLSGEGKRLFDLAIALPLLIVLAPLLAAIALAVRLETKGPALFRQTRSGMCGRPFKIFKFRTMTVQEDGASVVQAREADPRVTRLGAFLRRYSLDELPQLLNVILGDMSLVGPRPHAMAHDDFYQSRISEYRHRFAAKPGMTGWAQVNGLRGPTPALEQMTSRVSHDVFYVRRASFSFDLKVLLSTPIEIIRPRNAV
ncbi:lipopolysaccharide/colanic/teichoic acid biosynthesis glycosyltransferase [Rhizomicrobium palustre]|uniref:Lipopolysaccharide/colanic/teichoic acid biosynthesis glycosyltransferase n=1 Tax=Rhizomicrobium palustre TaxID=189966 RepID=A0A846MZN7_9PROT|nr:sugar transferase [Rhizomicrobium palustre]NIK88472.1 lipopolysaccharide/colanic/teichoic acid biosynthesis glycosyltransferase [Rhizomicrobium palustre]